MGIPNRQVASELNAAGVPVRWCNTRVKQCHHKMIAQSNAQQSEMDFRFSQFYSHETLKTIIWKPIYVWLVHHQQQYLPMLRLILIRLGPDFEW